MALASAFSALNPEESRPVAISTAPGPTSPTTSAKTDLGSIGSPATKDPATSPEPPAAAWIPSSVAASLVGVRVNARTSALSAILRATEPAGVFVAALTIELTLPPMPAEKASNAATGMPLAKPFSRAALTNSSLEKNSMMLSGLVMSIPAS